MPDPLLLTVLGAAATQGVTFLYAQAAELLKARRERRRSPVEAAGAGTMEVAIVDNDVLDGTSVSPVVDADLLEREHKALERLSGALSSYALGLSEVDVSDRELSEQAAALRALLEAVYGQRLTFRAEDREPTGARVTVDMVLTDVAGAVTGSESDVRPGGSLSVSQQVDRVQSGGDVTGHRGSIG